MSASSFGSRGAEFQGGPPGRPGADGARPLVTVLVADDSDNDRARTVATLGAAGYRVVEARDGQHALEVYRREHPDLVLLDVVMPRLTGLETCRILKARAQAHYLPVLMLSTRNSVNARVEGLRTGADDYLGKPYDKEELLARVEALLRARSFIAQKAATATLDEKVDRSAGGERSRGSETAGGDPLEIPLGVEAATPRLQEEFDRARRYSDPLAVLRIEPDTSPRGEGAIGGSDLLQIVAESVRKIDQIYAVGTSGFLVVLPNTHFPGALAVAERVSRGARARVESQNGGGSGGVGIGIAFFPSKDVRVLSDLLDAVQAALQSARAEGAGKICLYQHQGYIYTPED